MVGDLEFQVLISYFSSGWADEGGGPYRLTLGLLGQNVENGDNFTGFRSQRPREMKAAKGKVEKKLPESHLEIHFLGILAHRTSDDWGVQSPPKRKVLGSMKPFSVSVSQDP